MDLSYCYIDYGKSPHKSLQLSDTKLQLEYSFETENAILYFGISQQTSTLQLEENAQFIILRSGHVESNLSLLAVLREKTIQACLEELEGIFSFVIFDKYTKRVYLTRDSMGIRPLYYYQKEDFILISNKMGLFRECEAFEKKINYQALGQYFQHGYIQQPYSIILDCHKVKAAHYVTFDLTTKQQYSTKYWDIADFYNLPRVTESEASIIEKTQALLSQTITQKVNNQKHIGSFLSGGYDSSTIVALIKSLTKNNCHTFTAGFHDQKVNEAPYAKRIANYLKSEHHEYYVDAGDLELLLKDVTKVYDEPIGDKAVLPTMLIFEAASKEGIEMIFSGEGGDEIFAASGFMSKFQFLHTIPYPLRLLISKLLKLSVKLGHKERRRCEKWANMFAEKEIAHILKYKDITLSFSDIQKLLLVEMKEQPLDFSDTHFTTSTHYIDAIFALILKSYVSDNLLTKITSASHYYNHAVSMPYLDTKVLTFLAQVDYNLKSKNGTNKYILKQILSQLLPSSLIERPKKGFSVPVAKMLKNELRTLLDDYINPERIQEEGILNVDEVMKIKSQFLASDSYYDEQNIWNLLIFELWYDEWFNK